MRVLALGAITLASAGVAQQSVKETTISGPAAASWSFEGNPKVKQVDAEELPCGKAPGA